MQQLKDQGTSPKMPPAPLCGYMVDYLFDAGPALGGNSGAVPLSHSEIAAWMANTGVELSAWEASTLRSLSIAHVDQVRISSAPDCPPPWAPSLAPVDRAKVSKQVQNAFQMLIQTRPKGKAKK